MRAARSRVLQARLLFGCSVNNPLELWEPVSDSSQENLTCFCVLPWLLGGWKVETVGWFSVGIFGPSEIQMNVGLCWLAIAQQVCRRQLCLRRYLVVIPMPPGQFY